MKAIDTSGKPRSLTEYFEAPADFTGSFGWVCGYSADADFMNEAAERFTRQSQGQRAYVGKVALILMLDPGNPNLGFVSVPGIAHLPLRSLSEKPFVLLHAKVAILFFHHPSDSNQWVLRLVVSTGNWTRQTLEQSLDLAWSVEVSSADLKARDDDTIQCCADISAATDMFAWLRPHFDTRILHTAGEAAALPITLLDELLASVRKKAGRRKPRFFSSVKASLLSQLPTLINELGRDDKGLPIKRNYLALGSGFYEKPPEKEQQAGTWTARQDLVPAVLQDIVAEMHRAELVTKKPEVDVYVNPDACQTIAHCLPWFQSQGFTLRAARSPEKLFGTAKRTLHAKFIFSANWRKGSSLCLNPWVYLGSGNLTNQGFLNKASRQGGHLEAGVVFVPEGIHWVCVKGAGFTTLVTDCLPIQWDSSIEDEQHLKAGDGMKEFEPQYTAAPVAWLHWHDDGKARYLQMPEGENAVFSVLDPEGNGHAPDPQGQVYWAGERPREVTLLWRHEGATQRAMVPVLDEFGRIAGAALQKLGLDQAWWQLSNFPLPPDEDDLGRETDDPDTDVAPPQARGAAQAAEAIYPIRQMMELVENIADKQTQLRPTDWIAWCIRLQQSLLQAASNPVLAGFMELGINPLSPLWSAPFRPDFAEDNQTPEGKRYEAALLRVEEAWGVASLEKLGSHHA